MRYAVPLPLILLISLVLPAFAQQEAKATVQLAESYLSPYAGEDATGDHVVALWQFDGDEAAQDLSGHGHDLRLQGAQFSPDGKFGGALETFPGWPVEDAPHRASAKVHPDLTPRGAFTVEMWIRPKPDMKGYPESFLLDNRYVDKTGMQLVLSAESGALRNLRMELGFGADTEVFASDRAPFEVDVWTHVAFTYDGAGTGSFFINGSLAGTRTAPGRKDVAPGVKDLMIGDRVGSYYHGFPGFIDQVRICKGALEFRPAAFSVPVQRKVFVRMEPEATISLDITNKLRTTVSGARAVFQITGMPPQTVELPDLGPGETHRAACRLDTTLRPDDYSLVATIQVPSDPPFTATERFLLTIVPRKLPNTMPVLMWGAGLKEIDRLKDIGFTHAIGLGADYKAIWEAKSPTRSTSEKGVADQIEAMDNALRNGIFCTASLSPGRWARELEEYARVKRDGQPTGKEHDVCASNPAIREFCYNVGASVAQTFGDHPDLESALIHTEVRGETQVCFHEHDREAFRKFAGYDIPDKVTSARGVSYQEIDDFPADRVIPDDYPLYVYYRWFWAKGDGWNDLHTAVHDGLKSTGRDDLWTFHDPAVRCPSVYGSGGNVDYLAHWTYSYPDPLRIGLCTDELLCMAGGADRPDQQVMKMTQVIWYRSQTAPEPGEEAKVQTADFIDQDVKPRGTGAVDASGRYLAEWERRIPDARFITIAPMHMREAFWAKISRPIKGIMYHGWQSLVDCEEQHSSYRYTHPETKHELRRLVDTVVEPLGPSLVQIPDRPSDVAFLESFASQTFARKGTWGWNGGWAGDAYLILHYAGLQPQVIYDETVQRKGLDGFRVLVLVDCDVLLRSVVDKIRAFQAAGGIVVGDENLCPAIQPDILLHSYQRPKEADMARANMMEAAENLWAELAPHYTRYASASDPSVITRVRSYGSTDYLFAINDLREFGDYVGHHGLVMENGLPINATLAMERSGAHVYDLVRHREVRQANEGGKLSLDVALGPCEGRLYMVTSQPVAGVNVETPETAAPGEPVTIKAAVVDPSNTALDAVVPVKVEILDPHGRPAEMSGYYGAKDGVVEIGAVIAANDVPGLWRVHVTELASGIEADGYFRVQTTAAEG